MDQLFKQMFSVQPDEMTDGVYFYRNKWWTDLEEKIAPAVLNLSIEEIRRQREQNWLGQGEYFSVFAHHWESRNSQDEFNLSSDAPCLKHYKGSEKIDEFEEIINKIAHDNKPFLDIASCEGMGFVPFIVKKNPEIPCLVTDIDGHLIKCLNIYAKKELANYNINFASFDNSDIPIKDESLDYVTSNMGITSSGLKPAAGSVDNIFQYSAGKEKVIDEVFRILKPGGYFITSELSRKYNFDPQMLDNNFNKYGKLFGIYTYDEIQAVAALLKEDRWRDKFIAAGFRVEAENNFFRKYSADEVKKFLYTVKPELYKYENMVYEDIGIELYNTESFYILQKPDIGE